MTQRKKGVEFVTLTGDELLGLMKIEYEKDPNKWFGISELVELFKLNNASKKLESLHKYQLINKDYDGRRMIYQYKVLKR